MNPSIACPPRYSAPNLLANQAATLKNWPRTQLALIAMSALSLTLGSATIARAQVVQLPSQHVFSGSGSVLVPDGGTAALGGIGRSSRGSVRSGFGPLGNHASGGSSGGSSMSISVRIIDLEALDQAILAGASPRANAASTGVTTSPATSAAGIASPTTASPATASPAIELPVRVLAMRSGGNTSGRVGADPGKWQRELSGGSPSSTPTNLSLLESDIRFYVQQGEQAERAGSYQAARVYFQLARNAMTPELEEGYRRAVSARNAEAAARYKADQEAGRRKF